MGETRGALQSHSQKVAAQGSPCCGGTARSDLHSVARRAAGWGTQRRSMGRAALHWVAPRGRRMGAWRVPNGRLERAQWRECGPSTRVREHVSWDGHTKRTSTCRWKGLALSNALLQRHALREGRCSEVAVLGGWLSLFGQVLPLGCAHGGVSDAVHAQCTSGAYCSGVVAWTVSANLEITCCWCSGFGPKLCLTLQKELGLCSHMQNWDWCAISSHLSACCCTGLV